MITIKEITKKDTWTKFQEQNKPEALFQQWLWGEVQEKIGAVIYRYGMYADDLLVGIFQYAVIRAKRGAFLHFRHGPIFAEENDSYWKTFTEWVKKEGKKQRVLFIRISPLEKKSPPLESLLQGHGYRSAPIHAMDAELCWVLPLHESEETLLKNMRKTTRYEIKRASTSEVIIRTSTDPKDLIHFFALYKETSVRHGFVPHSGIQEEFELFSKTGNAMLFLGSYKKEIVSAAIILFIGNQGIYHHGASIRSEIPVSYLLQWEAIKEAKKRGMNVYNFWGIAPEDNPKHPWRGITLFKKGFGGTQNEYIHAHDLPISPLYMLPKGIETVRRILKGY